MIFYCKKCLYPFSKPDLWFKNRISGAYFSFKERSKYDWTNGQKIFRDLIKNKKNEKYAKEASSILLFTTLTCIDQMRAINNIKSEII